MDIIHKLYLGSVIGVLIALVGVLGHNFITDMRIDDLEKKINTINTRIILYKLGIDEDLKHEA